MKIFHCGNHYQLKKELLKKNIFIQNLLCTQIGNEVPKKGTELSLEKAIWIQKFLAENAYREIYAYEQNSEILKIRKHEVDRLKYQYEQQEWSEWHKSQTTAELNFSS